MIKKTISLLLCASIIIQGSNISLMAHATSDSTTESKENIIEEDKIYDYIDFSSVIVVNPKTANDVLDQSKFTAYQGHAFAAERGNNLIDKIKGCNAVVVGDDNAKNGPDRRIIDRFGNKTWIQDKYYKTAKDGVNACFEKNELGEEVFRYFDGDGKPMQIEVPSDQYDDAVLAMREKIEAGKVKGVTDANEAENIIRKGNITYKQAQNLAKAGNIDSLKYDATNGVISGSAAFGISTTINFTVRMINGEDIDTALKDSAIDGLKTGGMQFATAVIAGQLAKTSAKKIFEPSAEALVKVFGDDFAEAVVKAMGKEVLEEGAESLGKAATKKAATELLSANILVDVVSLVVFTTPDAIHLFQGKMSSKQFAKNLAVAVIGLAGGVGGTIGGAAIGSLIAPGIGTTIGAIVGGLTGDVGLSLAADAVADQLIKDDAEEMYEIVQEVFIQNCEDYLVTETEANNIIEQFQSELDTKYFEDMYQSEDRIDFVNEKMTPIFNAEVAKRPNVPEPTSEEMRSAMLKELEGVVYIH